MDQLRDNGERLAGEAMLAILEAALGSAGVAEAVATVKDSPQGQGLEVQEGSVHLQMREGDETRLSIGGPDVPYHMWGVVPTRAVLNAHAARQKES